MLNYQKKGSYLSFLVVIFIIFLTGCSGTPPIEPPVTPTLPVTNSTQGTSFSTIHNAINASSPGDIIIVSPGTYYENLDFEGKNITVRSTNSSDSGTVVSTIIDGNHTGAVVTFQREETAAAVLEGFTIKNGSGSNVGDWFKNGGGIYCYNSSPTISNNIILNNTADTGGGIYCSHSSPIISNNTIILNSAKGGGGIYCGDSSSPVITKNTISHNSASHNSGGGGILCYDSSPTITTNTISWNSAFKGGGIYSFDSVSTITGNTLSNNSATQQGGGIFVSKLSIVKDSHGNSWPRLNAPPNPETNNFYSENTHQGALFNTGADVYFESGLFNLR